MLKGCNLLKQLFAISEDGFMAISRYTSSSVSDVRRVIDVILQKQGHFDLLTLDDGKRMDAAKESGGYLASYVPCELDAVIWPSEVMPVHTESASIFDLERFDDGAIVHANSDIQLVSDMSGIRFLPFSDANVSFSIEKTRDVSIVHKNLLGCEWDVGEVGGHPMPGQKWRGRTIPNQASEQSLGVRNEHGPTPEGKMCSELCRNAETSAETIEAVDVYHGNEIRQQVTDCNTRYLFWRPHEDRNVVPLNPDRFSINQDAMVRLIGWAGNMCLSNSFMQAVLTA